MAVCGDADGWLAFPVAAAAVIVVVVVAAAAAAAAAVAAAAACVVAAANCLGARCATHACACGHLGVLLLAGPRPPVLLASRCFFFFFFCFLLGSLSLFFGK